MTLDPFIPQMYPALIFSIILTIFLLISSILMTFKWRERKLKATLYLTFMFWSIFISLLVLSIGLIEPLLTGYKQTIYKISLPFTYSMVVVVDYFLFLFANEIMRKGDRAKIPLIISGILIIVLHFLPWNNWGVPQSDIGDNIDLQFLSSLSLLIYSYFILIYIAIISKRLLKETTDKVAKSGLKLLFTTAIFFMGFFLLITLDALMGTFFDDPGYSGFLYLGYISLIIGLITSYLSLVMPGFLVKWLKKEK